MEENVNQINGGIMINVDVRVKNAMDVKKIMFGILLQIIVKIGKYLASIMDDSAIMCDEIIESRKEETDLMKIRQPVKHKTFIFQFHFY